MNRGGRSFQPEQDYESELALVVGRAADGVNESDALDYVAGFTVANDVRARRLQFVEMQAGGGSCAGKNVRTFGPLGPYLVTFDEIPDPTCLHVWSRANGEMRQDAWTTDMVFDIKKLIAWYSQIGLDVDDILMSGTPAGVAAGGKGCFSSLATRSNAAWTAWASSRIP